MSEQRKADYLPESPDYAALAFHADQAAVTATSRVAKNCWKTLAEQYRKLAAQQPPRSDRDANGAEDQD